MDSFPGRLPDRPILPAPEGAPHSPRLKAALQGGKPVHATMLPNGMLEHLHPGIVRTVSVLMKKPVYLVHPPGLTKAEGDIVQDLAAELASQGEHIPALLTPFGTVGGPGTASTSSSYNLSDRLNEVEELVKKYGYKTFLHSGRYAPPDPTHNFKTGFIGIEDPGHEDASAFNHERAKRSLHGLAQALTEPEIDKLYPDGSPTAGQKDVHWEDLASRKQRELAEQIGIHLPDDAFNREHNATLANAVHAAVGGSAAPLSQIGFAPHSHEVPLMVALDLVRDAQTMAKSEDLEKATAAYRHKSSGKVIETEYYHDRTKLPEHPSNYDEGYTEKGKFYTREEYRAKHPRKMHKAEPSAALHSTVEGFMQGLKALPKGSPARGKFITAHMGHPGFIAALQSHAQGPQIHQMLTAHLNSPANAGPGRGVVTAKSEDAVILSQEKNVADNINRKAALERIRSLQGQLEVLRKRESDRLAKGLIPPHKHNVGVNVGMGIEDVAPSRLNPDGKNDPLHGGTAIHNGGGTRKNELLAAERSREESTEGSREESSTPDVGMTGVVGKSELCKGCGKSECSCAKKSELVDSKGNHSSDDVVTKMPKASAEVSASGSGGQIKKGKSLADIRKAAMDMSKDKPKKPKDWKLGDPGAKYKGTVDSQGKPVTPQKKAKSPPWRDLHNQTEKAEPPMAKPPSGVNMATKMPASKPGNAMKPAAGGQLPKPTVAPKMPGLGKGVMSDIVHRESESMGAPKPVAPKTKLPGQQEQADRASMYAGAMAGDYTPPAAAKPAPATAKPRVLAVNPLGAVAATKPRPGIFGRLGKK